MVTALADGTLVHHEFAPEGHDYRSAVVSFNRDSESVFQHTVTMGGVVMSSQDYTPDDSEKARRDHLEAVDAYLDSKAG